MIITGTYLTLGYKEEQVHPDMLGAICENIIRNWDKPRGLRSDMAKQMSKLPQDMLPTSASEDELAAGALKDVQELLDAVNELVQDHAPAVDVSISLGDIASVFSELLGKVDDDG
jgi:hypothetical protein